MGSMFEGCNQITSLSLFALWNVSNVKRFNTGLIEYPQWDCGTWEAGTFIKNINTNKAKKIILKGGIEIISESQGNKTITIKYNI